MGKILLIGGFFVGAVGIFTIFMKFVFLGDTHGYGAPTIMTIIGFGVGAFGSKLDDKEEQKKEKEFSEKGKDDLLEKF